MNLLDTKWFLLVSLVAFIRVEAATDNDTDLKKEKGKYVMREKQLIFHQENSKNLNICISTIVQLTR